MIKGVILHSNGMVMVFDENGEQMPSYQGEFSDVYKKITDKYKGMWCVAQWPVGINHGWLFRDVPFSLVSEIYGYFRENNFARINKPPMLHERG